MQYSIVPFGSFQAIDVYSSQGHYWQILTMGASLNAYTVHAHNCIVGYAHAADLPQATSLGCRSAQLFPFVCRLQNGSYTWQGNSYTVDGFYLGQHALHGFVFQQPFTIQQVSVQGQGCTVVLAYTYTGGMAGYPFPFQLLVTYTLHPQSGVSVHTTITNTGSHSLPYAHGWHPYFTLGGAIDSCNLHISQSQYVTMTDELLPTGQTTANTLFTTPETLNHKKLDDCFYTPNATVTLQNTQWQLQVRSLAGYAYVQVYTPDDRASIAIENLSGAPNCFNNGMGLQTLLPNASAELACQYVLTAL
jgi:aldose 1-epimerase